MTPAAIARQWSARTTAELAPAYAEYLKAHVIPQLRAIDGYRGATLLQRAADGQVEVQVVTWWASLDAIRAFSGSDEEAAVVTDRAAALLGDFDARARHFTVVVADEPR
jgi:heme-degrading monooxygenase HmoA